MQVSILPGVFRASLHFINKILIIRSSFLMVFGFAVLTFTPKVKASHEKAAVSDIDHTGMGSFSGSYTHSHTDHVWIIFNANAGNTITFKVNTGFKHHYWLYKANNGCIKVGNSLTNGCLNLMQSGGGGAASGTYTFSVSTAGQYAFQLDAFDAVFDGGSGSYSVGVSGSSATTSLCTAAFTTCPSNITTNTNSGCKAIVNYTAVGPGGNYLYSFSGATTGNGFGTGSGSAFNCGTTNVTVTTPVNCGSISKCSFTITVKDSQKPVINNCPADISKRNDEGLCGAFVIWTPPSTTDNCGATFSTTHSPEDFFPIGTTTVTYTSTDAAGNKATGEFDVTIVDNEDPVVKCKPASVTLVNGIATITIDDINDGSTDNCGIESIVASKTTFDCSNIGQNTVTLTVEDIHGHISTCDATVTVVGTIPSISVSQAVQPAFCQGGSVVLSTTTNEAVNYAWSSNANSATTAGVKVNSSGTYSVTVTNSNGCTASASATVKYDAFSLVSSYTILVSEKAKLEKESVIKSGGVGSTDTNGEIELKDSSFITASGTFAKAQTITINSGSSITNSYSGSPVSVTLPNFVSNPYCEVKIKEEDDLKVKKEVTVVITDSIFRKIKIEDDAIVTFTSKNIYAEEIHAHKNVTIIFSGCTRIYLCKELKLDENNVFNYANKSVVIYADNNVHIKKGTTLTANIYSKDKIDSHGDKNYPNTLKGMFISKELSSHYTNFSWNTACGSCGSLGKRSLASNTGEGTVDNVNVYPNPAEAKTTVTVNAAAEGILKIKLVSLRGETLFNIEKSDFKGIAEIPIDLTNYAAGMYFIHVAYGTSNEIFKVQHIK